MKLSKVDVFTILPLASVDLAHLPHALQEVFKVCGGIRQSDDFELWGPDRIRALPGTKQRWLEIGAAGPQRLIFDAVADRGVAVIDPQKGVIHVSSSIGEFLELATLTPQIAFWLAPSCNSGVGQHLLWPDEDLNATFG